MPIDDDEPVEASEAPLREEPSITASSVASIPGGWTTTGSVTGITYAPSITDKTIPWEPPEVDAEARQVEERISIDRDPDSGEITATIPGSELVCGSGETVFEAIEALQVAIGGLLDYVYGANGERPTLHPNMLTQVTALESVSKKLGIYTS